MLESNTKQKIFRISLKKARRRRFLLAAEYAYLAIWLAGMFGIIGIVIGAVARFTIYDSLAHDEQLVWRRKLPADAYNEK